MLHFFLSLIARFTRRDSHAFVKLSLHFHRAEYIDGHYVDEILLL